MPHQPSSNSLEAEFIVVGSGAGGGTVAARLAESGHSVLLLEAGTDPKSPGGGATDADDYDVPAFHPRATENETMRWDFFVRHFSDPARAALDPKYVDTWQGRRVDGVYYPRAGTLGGCTAHNAMILIYPHKADWNELADLTGDASWRADRMRRYFEKIENCGYRQVERTLSKVGINRTGHGWNGWLHTERALPRAAVRDRDLREVLIESARAAMQEYAKDAKFWVGDFSNREADPNDAEAVSDDGMGVRYTPLTTRNHARVGTRERLLEVRDRHPDRLRILTNALVTRVILDANQRATGVEYLAGERLYRAHARPSTAAGELRHAFASREVILCGGAFNTPQLLMLSGIGEPAQLARHGIAMVVDLPGVGKNLQDRYEVAVVNRMAFDSWEVMKGATLTRNDPQYQEWSRDRDGVYATNGSLLSVVIRSSLARPVADLFCYALLAEFRGYFPGYAQVAADSHNCLTWIVLKGHTNNTAGTVTLRSADPQDPPDVHFHFFDDGNDGAGEDLKSVVRGVSFVRKLAAPLKAQGLIAKEELPGDDITDEKLTEWVRNNAWGHHAAGTCRIGAREQGGVLSSDFKVHGTEGLRVVDASVFPRIPGLFIVSAVYMVGEKAADVILADAKRNVPAPRATPPVGS